MRVALVYAAVGWGVVVGSSDLTQILGDLPQWFPQVVFALVILGFPVAVALAWAFDASPDGVRKAPPLRSATADRPSRWPVVAGLVVGTLALTAVVVVLWDPGPPDPGISDLDKDRVVILPFDSPDETLGDEVFLLMMSLFTGEARSRGDSRRRSDHVGDCGPRIGRTQPHGAPGGRGLRRTDRGRL